MTSGHTFHTPSFGDEEFELPPVMNTASVGNTYEIQNLGASQDTHSQWSVGNQQGDILEKNNMSNFRNSNEILVLHSPSSEMNQNSSDQYMNIDENEDHYYKTSLKLQVGETQNDAGSNQMDDRKKRRDLNEPRKPVPSYALFFRDTQAAIKGQNPNASFGEISKIVASMWDALDPEHKNVYKKKAEIAKREYLKLLAAYRANAISKGDDLNIANNSQLERVNPKNSISKIDTSPYMMTTLKSMQNKTSSLTGAGSSIQRTDTTHISSSGSNQQVNSNQNIIQDSINSNLNESSFPQNLTLLTNSSTNLNETQKCIRNGCTNTAIISLDWEDEYCSNECVISHCRDVFSQWVQGNCLQLESYTT